MYTVGGFDPSEQRRPGRAPPLDRGDDTERRRLTGESNSLRRAMATDDLMYRELDAVIGNNSINEDDLAERERSVKHRRSDAERAWCVGHDRPPQ
jgi:hypothetical protein